MSELNVEEGKRYRRGDGGVTGPLRRNAHAVDETSEYTDGIGEWSKSGRWSVLEKTEYDLVEEYVEAEPLKWKRGVPTEEECRECWIFSGNSKPVPDSLGVIYAPGEVVKRDYFGNSDWYIALRIDPVEPRTPKTVTQRQYYSIEGEELWTHATNVKKCWVPTGLTREVPV